MTSDLSSNKQNYKQRFSIKIVKLTFKSPLLFKMYFDHFAPLLNCKLCVKFFCLWYTCLFCIASFLLFLFCDGGCIVTDCPLGPVRGFHCDDAD